MGAWGIGILQNDTTGDVWAEFKHLYNLGLSPIEIREKLEKEYNPEEDEYADFWTGIAHGQWMCCELEEYTINKVQKCISEKKGMALWEEDEKDYKKRLIVIQEFIDKIRIPREKPLKRKKIIPCPSYFEKGDIVSIAIDDDNFTFALVFEKEEDKIDGGNRLIFTNLISKSTVSEKEFLNAEILYLDMGGYTGYYKGYFWAQFEARNMKRKIKHSTVIGNILFDDYLELSNSMPYGDWNNLSELYHEQLDFLENKKSRKPKKLTIKDFIGGENKKLELDLAKHANELFREGMNEMNAS